MPTALFIGGTRFIGRHAVETFREAGYAVTLFNRGTHDNPFAEDEDVDHYKGDRTSDAALEGARDAVAPDVVVDLVAYHPGEVRMATEIFADVDAYVYVSSGAAYEPDVVPKREEETALEPCTEAQAVDDSMASYGARKAEGDRAVFEAAEDGVRAMSVRPTVVYGPHDYTGRLDYWIARVAAHDRVVVPGDGNSLHHLVAVENVARALLTVAEAGDAGEAYNVGDRQAVTLGEVLETVAAAQDTDVEVVTASARELATADLQPDDFPLYATYPHLLATAKLAALGWEPVDPATALAEMARFADEPGTDSGPARERTAAVLDHVG